MVLLAILIMFLVYSYSEHKLHQNKEWVGNVQMWISQGYRTGERYFSQLSDFLSFWSLGILHFLKFIMNNIGEIDDS